jgi:glucose/arabinose dehydrogenase
VVSPPTARRARSSAVGVLFASILFASVVLASWWATATTAGAASKPPRLELRRVAPLAAATAMATRAGDPALYVTTQDGKVVALRGKSAPVTVLDVTSRVRSGGEQGLLGLAFAPDGTKLYVHYSGAAAGETVLDEYAVVDGRPDPSTRRLVLTVPQPQVNHNGGQLAFGPDGYLYMGLGDGGAAGDRGSGHAPGGNGQSLNTLLGKILRIDPRPSGGDTYTVPADNPFVGTPQARPEIYVYGVRNPWRFSFDRETGDLWVGDVGQNQYEEVTRLPAGSIAGSNLGWNLFEGTHTYREGPDTEVVMPIVELNHDDGNCSVTGGYVYRGKKIPGLRGWYLYTDYCNGALRAVKVDADGQVQQQDLGITASNVSSFGQDNAGELYVLSQSAGVFRVVAR